MVTCGDRKVHGVGGQRAGGRGWWCVPIQTHLCAWVGVKLVQLDEFGWVRIDLYWIALYARVGTDGFRVKTILQMHAWANWMRPCWTTKPRLQNHNIFHKVKVLAMVGDGNGERTRCTINAKPWWLISWKGGSQTKAFSLASMFDIFNKPRMLFCVSLAFLSVFKARIFCQQHVFLCSSWNICFPQIVQFISKLRSSPHSIRWTFKREYGIHSAREEVLFAIANCFGCHPMHFQNFENFREYEAECSKQVTLFALKRRGTKVFVFCALFFVLCPSADPCRIWNFHLPVFQHKFLQILLPLFSCHKCLKLKLGPASSDGRILAETKGAPHSYPGKNEREERKELCSNRRLLVHQ